MFFPLISSFNIWFIRDWVSWLVATCFLYGYLSLMTHVVSLASQPGWPKFFVLIDIFFQFHPSIFGWLEINLYDLFSLFSIRLFRSHNLNHAFYGLTSIDFNGFIVSFFKIDLFSNSIFPKWIYWESNFIIFFDLICMRLSQSHDSGHKFGMLTRVYLGYFFI
jgi:hypothetical protein